MKKRGCLQIWDSNPPPTMFQCFSFDRREPNFVDNDYGLDGQVRNDVTDVVGNDAVGVGRPGKDHHQPVAFARHDYKSCGFIEPGQR